jgi:hypothetical protein
MNWAKAPQIGVICNFTPQIEQKRHHMMPFLFGSGALNNHPTWFNSEHCSRRTPA